MQLVKSIRVENFRSIRLIEIDSPGDYNPIVGLNSSGKSNVLRALNLFFNNIVDEDSRELNLIRDFSDYAPTGKKKYITSHPLSRFESRMTSSIRIT
ncbi:AAA family ATPase [Amycolatopsis saalfeldensis]|uniref:AAA ATPase domain-containing protein n=1 Tax=Amycolatopsis saalfeldensis TaxID=394193 RepID=A0A1H8R899_9PSEU|nr:AAA ATPase domain-containing protein [Amycolatopsis saalfeldensis]